MRDKEKTKEQLIKELEKLRQHAAKLEKHQLESRQTEEALQKSEEKWRSLTENSPDHVMLLDRDGKIQFINRTVPDLTIEEVLGRPVYDFLLPEFQKVAAGCIEKVLRTGQADLYETDYISKEGETQYFETRVGPVLDSSKIIGVICSASNITERKKTGDRLKSLLSALPEIIFIMDEEGRHIEVLTSEHGLLIHELPILKGSLIEDTIPKESADLFLEKIRKTIETRENQVFEYQLRVPKGKIWFEGRTAPLNYTFDGKQAIVWLAIDITNRKNLEEQLRQAQKMESMGILAGGIAHEFNNLLSPILGYTGRLMDKQTEMGSGEADLEQIHLAGQRAAVLVQQILAFSRQSMAERKHIHLEETVKEALQFLAHTLPSTISIQQEIVPNLPQIMGFSHEIHQVLVNLCINANHSMPEGGELKVSLKEEGIRELANSQGQKTKGPFVCLSIQDTGRGMDKTTLKHIFDPFFTTKEVGQGTGLGLSVVLGIVEQHAGIIEVDSEIGKGSNFRIYFPITQEKKAATFDLKPSFISEGNERILLVDDEPIVKNTSRALLEDLGYEVTAFTDSREVLAAFQKHPEDFDLIITDYTMPGMTGKALAEKLKEIRSNIPIILTTGYNEVVNKENVRKWGIDALLMKPAQKEDLSQIVRKVLGQTNS